MYHSGVQRTRGGRHGYSPVKHRSNSVEHQKYPTIQPPNISAVIAAANAAAASMNSSSASSPVPVATPPASATSSNSPSSKGEEPANIQPLPLTTTASECFEPTDVVSVTMSSPEPEDTVTVANRMVVDDHSVGHSSQIWEQFVQGNVRNEVEMLKSRTAIAETLLAEKTKQLDIVERQVAMLKQHLLQADKLNKDQASLIESLKKKLANETSTASVRCNGSKMNSSSSTASAAATIERVGRRHDLGDQHSHHGRSNNSQQQNNNRLPMVFENGGVTITPVVTSSPLSSSMSSHHHSTHSTPSTNLLQHLLRDGMSVVKSGDMATIEPVRSNDSYKA